MIKVLRIRVLNPEWASVSPPYKIQRSPQNHGREGGKKSQRIERRAVKCCHGCCTHELETAVIIHTSQSKSGRYMTVCKKYQSR